MREYEAKVEVKQLLTHHCLGVRGCGIAQKNPLLGYSTLYWEFA